MVSSRNINHNRIENLDNVRYLSKDIFEIENQRTKLNKGDILFTSVGSLGRSCIYNGDLNLCFQRSVSIIHTLVYNYWLKYFFDSDYYQNIVVEKSTGTAQVGFYLQQLSESIVAIPPLAEQKMIVAEIEKWFALIDEIEQNKVDLRDYIKQTKSKVLDLAIHGKLVPQDPNDEPAIDLLKRINPSFKPCDTSHYENLPSGWCISYLKDAGIEILNGYAFQSKNYVPNGIKVIRITNVQDGYIVDDDPKYYPISSKEEIGRYLLHENDLLMSLTGNVGRVGFLQKEMLPAALNQRVGCIRGTEQVISKKYLYYFLQSDLFKTDCIDSAKGVAQLNISTEWLKAYEMPIPPVEEQIRISTKIEQIFTAIDTITAEL